MKITFEEYNHFASIITDIVSVPISGGGAYGG